MKCFTAVGHEFVRTVAMCESPAAHPCGNQTGCSGSSFNHGGGNQAVFVTRLMYFDSCLPVTTFCDKLQAFSVCDFQALHQKILEHKFIIVKSKDLVWQREDSERFYAEHKGTSSGYQCKVLEN